MIFVIFANFSALKFHIFHKIAVNTPNQFDKTDICGIIISSSIV